MKIIHCADVHLGSKIDSKFPKHVSDSRKEEVRNTFQRMVEYAATHQISVILLAGDVFDGERCLTKDKNFFFSVVENNPDITFLYLRGNHDNGNHDNGGEGKQLPNLKTFSTQWTSYRFGDVVISGIETESENATSLYSTLALDENAKNIVMLHGQIGESSGKDKVHLSKLRDKHIDYLALGHIHEYSSAALDGRGVYAYSGCLEGRGFDETGEKGFILLDIGEKITHEFIPFSKRKITKLRLDVTGLSDAYEMAVKAREFALKKADIYRVELIGEVEAALDGFARDVQKYLSDCCAFIDVKDCTQKKIDISLYDGDSSLKGEFVREVYSSGDYTEEEKAQIIAFGLKALDGREVDA